MNENAANLNIVRDVTEPKLQQKCSTLHDHVTKKNLTGLVLQASYDHNDNLQ
jgi:hypothetical protein